MLIQLPLCERLSKRKGEERSQQACCSFMTTRQCTSAKSQAAIRQCGFQQLNHPPYSPDLALSDYFLFRDMKKFLRGKRFSSDEEVKEVVTTWFEEQSKDFFFQGDKVVTTKVGKVYWDIRGLHWKIKKYFFCDKLFLSYKGRYITERPT